MGQAPCWIWPNGFRVWLVPPFQKVAVLEWTAETKRGGDYVETSSAPAEQTCQGRLGAPLTTAATTEASTPPASLLPVSETSILTFETLNYILWLQITGSCLNLVPSNVLQASWRQGPAVICFILNSTGFKFWIKRKPFIFSSLSICSSWCKRECDLEICHLLVHVLRQHCQIRSQNQIHSLLQGFLYREYGWKDSASQAVQLWFKWHQRKWNFLLTCSQNFSFYFLD